MTAEQESHQPKEIKEIIARIEDALIINQELLGKTAETELSREAVQSDLRQALDELDQQTGGPEKNG